MLRRVHHFSNMISGTLRLCQSETVTMGSEEKAAPIPNNFKEDLGQPTFLTLASVRGSETFLLGGATPSPRV